MASLVIENDRLIVKLSAWEKLGALRKDDVSVALSNIVSVERVDDARDGIRGLRSPGTGVPGVVALGTWRTRHTVDFVATSRKASGYLVELQDERFDRLVIASEPLPELDHLI